MIKKMLVALLLMTSCGEADPALDIGNIVKEKSKCPYFISSFGGSGPGEKYEDISIGYTVDHYLTLREGRRKILDLQQVYVDTINSEKKFKDLFAVAEIKRSNIHLGLLLSPYLENRPWEITIIATHNKSISYNTRTTINGDWAYYDLGEETYDEALKVAYGCGPFKRVITSTKLGYKGIPLELHGPWGFFIEKVVIPQIQSGEFIYYAQVNGEEWKLAVCGDQVVVEATGQPIREFFPPAPED